MKKITLILITLFGVQSYMSAQCVRSGTFIPDSPNTSTYPIEGTANITKALDGTMSVNFEGDFKSVQGFLLQVFLSKTQEVNSNTPNPNVYIRVDQNGDLRCDAHNSTERSHNGEGMTGAKSFTQNLDGVDISEYSYIILQCVEFNVPWGYAKLGDVTGSNCNILSVEDKEFEAIGLAQNPVEDYINITNPTQQQLEIRIFDTVGNLVATQAGKRQENRMDVSTFASGLYVVELSTGIQRKTQQLVIR